MKLINSNWVNHRHWGTNGAEELEDPLYSRWCGLLAEPYLKENMTILDYGCGCGRLANYISSKLENFKYYGLDVEDYAIDCAKTHYTDPRVSFGYINSALEKEAISNADLVVLGSILTHMPMKLGLTILRKFQPTLNKKANISLSVFWDEKETKETLGATIGGDPNWRTTAIYAKKELDRHLGYDKTGDYLAQGVFIHHIVSVNRIGRDRLKDFEGYVGLLF